jgi:hypothetical protein
VSIAGEDRTHLGNRQKSRRDLDNHTLPASCETLGRRREKTDRTGEIRGRKLSLLRTDVPGSQHREQGERVFFVTQITGTHTSDLILPDLPLIPPTGTKIVLPHRHLEYFVKDEAITTITADFSPNALEEMLAQKGDGTAIETCFKE